MTEENKEVQQPALEDRVTALEYWLKVFHEELREHGPFTEFVKIVHQQSMQKQLNDSLALLEENGYKVVPKTDEELETPDNEDESAKVDK